MIKNILIILFIHNIICKLIDAFNDYDIFHRMFSKTIATICDHVTSYKKQSLHFYVENENC